MLTANVRVQVLEQLVEVRLVLFQPIIDVIEQCVVCRQLPHQAQNVRPFKNNNNETNERGGVNIGGYVAVWLLKGCRHSALERGPMHGGWCADVLLSVERTDKHG